MYKPLQFQPEVESLVRFVEETDAARIIPETLARLRGGTPPRELLRASALAVVRSTELPPGHHGGPVHPISGLHGCLHTARRLPGELAYLPLVQHVAVSNHHVRSPHMGPYIMPHIEPRDGTVNASYHVYHDIESSVVHLGAAVRQAETGDRLPLTVAAFLNNVESRRPVAAEQCLLWLLDHETPDEVLDHLLPLCVARNHMDDHNFLYPVLTMQALEDIGLEWARVLMRPVVRYHARPVSDISIDPSFGFHLIEEAMREFGLGERELAAKTSSGETAVIAALAERIGASRRFAEHIELLAQALADGLSLEGAVEALSVGASTIFVSTTYGNPMDSHLHTGTNGRRFLLRLPGVSQRAKVMALLSGVTGPECTLSEPLMTWVPPVEPAVRAALPRRDEDGLLAAITRCVEEQPKVDWRSIARIDLVTAPTVARDAMALAEQYQDEGGDPMRLLARLGELVSRDDFTELHAIKQHQAIVEEFLATRESLRGIHLVAAVKSAVCIRAGKEQSVYDELRPMLH